MILMKNLVTVYSPLSQYEIKYSGARTKITVVKQLPENIHTPPWKIFCFAIPVPLKEIPV